MTTKKTKEKREGNNGASNDIGYEETKCGYIMPIAEVAGYEIGHWEDVSNILNQVLLEMGFKEENINIVSEDEGVGTIHKRIVNNIYNNDIVICDVSSRNPNVMFELGMRIAFDKPLVIIKDDCTDYCFDSGTIEHINYPKSLRFSKIEAFKDKLSRKIKGTISEARRSPEESPILKSFGSFDVSEKEIPKMNAYEEMSSDLQDIKAMVRRLSLDKRTFFDSNCEMPYKFPERQTRRSAATSMVIDIDSIDASFEDILSTIKRIDPSYIMNKISNIKNVFKIHFEDSTKKELFIAWINSR